MKSYHNQKEESIICIKNHEKLLEIAEKGLMNLSIELGLEALQQMLEQDVTDLVGPRGKHSGDRKGYRHGTEQTQVVLGGQKMSARRPRARSLDGHELELESLKLFQARDPLTDSVLARLLSGVSCRKYAQTLDIPQSAGNSTSKSTVNRRFTQAMEGLMTEFFSRQLSDDDYPVLMLDGVALSDITVVAAMGITRDGHKKRICPNLRGN